MEFKEYICIWNNSLEESKKEFVKEFLNITSTDKKEGIYTFLFTRLSVESNSLVTDVLYAYIFNKSVILLWPYSNSLIIELDNELNAIDAIYKPVDNNIMGELIETQIELVGILTTIRCHLLATFVLKEPIANNLGKEIYNKLCKHDFLDIEKSLIDEEVLIDLSIKCLNNNIDEYMKIVNNSINNDHADARLIENPYADRFYNKDDVAQPLSDAKRLGDNNV